MCVCAGGPGAGSLPPPRGAVTADHVPACCHLPGSPVQVAGGALAGEETGEGLWGLPAGRKGPQLQEEMSEGLFVASLEALTTKAALGTLPRGNGGTRTCWNDPEAAVAKQKPAAVCSHAGIGLIPHDGLSVTSRTRGRLLGAPSAPRSLPRSRQSGEGDAHFLIQTHKMHFSPAPVNPCLPCATCCVNCC